MHADLQRLLADDLLTDFTSKPMERLRSLRVQLNEAEADVSFVRRVTQGRLDIVGHEAERRSVDRTGNEPPSDSATDPDPSADDAQSSLLFDMPNILSDAEPAADGDGDGDGGGHGSRSLGSPGRAVSVQDPGPVALSLIDVLDRIASPPQLSGIDAVTRPDLADLFDALREFELELSSIRRKLHDRIDSIQDEIARRYRDGEATVDALLQ